MPKSQTAGANPYRAEGAWVRQAREQAGLTMQQAADAVSLSLSGVSNIELGRNGASMETLRKMADAYGCLVGDLLPHTVPSASGQMAEPLLAALAGLDESEIHGWMTHFAQVASLQMLHVRKLSRQPGPQPAAKTNGTADDRPAFVGENRIG